MELILFDSLLYTFFGSSRLASEMHSAVLSSILKWPRSFQRNFALITKLDLETIPQNINFLLKIQYFIQTIYFGKIFLSLKVQNSKL